MRFTFEFFRIRGGDGAHATLDRVSQDAPDLEAAKDVAKTLFKTLNMPHPSRSSGPCRDVRRRGF